MPGASYFRKQESARNRTELRNGNEATESYGAALRPQPRIVGVIMVEPKGKETMPVLDGRQYSPVFETAQSIGQAGPPQHPLSSHPITLGTAKENPCFVI